MTTATMRWSEPELNVAFKRVCRSNDWRAPINKVLREATPEELEKIVEAVVFYTGTVPEVRELGNNTFHITAVGYRMGPCGP